MISRGCSTVSPRRCALPARCRFPVRGRRSAPGRAPRRAAPADALPAPLAGAFPFFSSFFFFFKYIFLFRPLVLSLLSEEEEGGEWRKGEILFEFTKRGIWCTLRLASVLLVSRAARSHWGEGQEGQACICWAPQ